MSPRLHVRLLGVPEVHLDGERINQYGTAKAEALFYYLVGTRQPHSREALAGLLWGESPDSRARRSLTNALSSLKKRFGDFLAIQPGSVAFNGQQPFDLDLARFEFASELTGRDGPTEFAEDVAEVYRGDFLEGFYVRNAPGFEDWLALERERLRNQIIQVLDALVQQRLGAGEFATGIRAARRLLELDPLRESAHRQLMLLLARSGQRSAALEHYEAVRRLLAGELGVEPMPETRAIHQRIKIAAAPVPHNLRIHALPFIGRLSEFSQVTAHLDDPACQLLTILGPGGIGKTRLATEAARWYTEPERSLGAKSFPDGVYFVSLAALPLSDLDEPQRLTRQQLSSLLSAALAAPIEFQFHGALDPMEQLARHVRDKEMLFVLDNFEFLISGAYLLSRLLQQATNVKLLVTSRERLNLTEEWVLTIDGLAYPGEDPNGAGGAERQAWKEEAARRFDAVALFYQQAAQVNVGRELSPEDEEAVVRITRLVEGSPLAILLAASWLRVLSCAEILQEIEQGIDFLSSSMRDLPARQQSLRAVFDQSWEMLSGVEQRVFRRLSVFRGGFTRTAAEAVAGATLGVLTGLLDKSMLYRMDEGRYGVHEALRVFGSERLSVNLDELKNAREAHIRYYADFLAVREQRLFLRENLGPLLEIRSEIDNIRAYWRRALADANALDYKAIDQGLWSLACYYTFCSCFQEAIDIFAFTADRLGQAQSSAQLGASESLIVENISVALGTFHHWIGDYNAASQRHLETLRELDQMDPATPGIDTVYGRALGFLGSTLLMKGDYIESEKALRRSLKRVGASDDRSFDGRSFIVWTTYQLGMSLHQLGRYRESERLLERALGSLSRSGDYLMHAQCLGYLARTKHELGHPLEPVLAQLETLRDHCREIGAPMLLVQANTHLGVTLNLMGAHRAQEAREALEEGLAFYLEHDLQVPSSLAYLLVALGQAETEMAADEQAEGHLREALEIAAANSIEPIAIEALGALAALWTRMDELPECTEAVLRLVATHPASSHVKRKAAEELLGELEGDGAGVAEPGGAGLDSLEALTSSILDLKL